VAALGGELHLLTVSAKASVCANI